MACFCWEWIYGLAENPVGPNTSICCLVSYHTWTLLNVLEDHSIPCIQEKKDTKDNWDSDKYTWACVCLQKSTDKIKLFHFVFRYTACAKIIFREQKEAIGDHLSLLIVPFCKSLCTTNLVFSLSSDPSLFTLPLNTSMTGVLTSPSSISSKVKVPLSTRVLISFLTDLSHSDWVYIKCH